MYASLTIIAQYFQWLLAAAISIILFRCVYIIHHMSNSLEDNVSISGIISKVQNHVKAIVIMAVAEGLIEFIKKYLFV